MTAISLTCSLTRRSTDSPEGRAPLPVETTRHQWLDQSTISKASLLNVERRPFTGASHRYVLFILPGHRTKFLHRHFDRACPADDLISDRLEDSAQQGNLRQHQLSGAVVHSWPAIPLLTYEASWKTVDLAAVRDHDHATRRQRHPIWLPSSTHRAARIRDQSTQAMIEDPTTNQPIPEHWSPVKLDHSQERRKDTAISTRRSCMKDSSTGPYCKIMLPDKDSHVASPHVRLTSATLTPARRPPSHPVRKNKSRSGTFSIAAIKNQVPGCPPLILGLLLLRQHYLRSHDIQ
jgi:hypothetical protein